MKRLLYFLLIGLVFCGCQTTSTVEDPATTHFIKFYGRDGDQTGRDLVTIPDGSMVLFGTTTQTVPTLGVQWYVVKVDAKGTIIWEKEFGGDGDEEARDIELTSANNIVLLGNTWNSSATPPNNDVMVMIISLDDGSVIDSARIGVRDVNTFLDAKGDEDASTITETSDGFIISGTSSYVDPNNPAPLPPISGLNDTRDALKIRLYADLTIYPTTWGQIYGLHADDGSVKIVPAPAGAFGNFYAFGFTNSVSQGMIPNYNYFMVVLSATGDPATVITYSGTAGDEVMSSYAPSVNGFFLCGLLRSSPSDFYVVEATVPDVILGYGLALERNLSINLGTNLNGHTAACRSASGGWYVLGEENGFNNNQNWVLVRVNSNGSLGWSHPIAFGGEGMDSAGSVQELPDGRVVIIGTMRTGRPDAGEYKMTLVKVNRDGKFEK